MLGEILCWGRLRQGVSDPQLTWIHPHPKVLCKQGCSFAPGRDQALSIFYQLQTHSTDSPLQKASGLTPLRSKFSSANTTSLKYTHVILYIASVSSILFVSRGKCCLMQIKIQKLSIKTVQVHFRFWKIFSCAQHYIQMCNTHPWSPSSPSTNTASLCHTQPPRSLSD